MLLLILPKLHRYRRNNTSADHRPPKWHHCCYWRNSGFCYFGNNNCSYCLICRCLKQRQSKIYLKKNKKIALQEVKDINENMTDMENNIDASRGNEAHPLHAIIIIYYLSQHSVHVAPAFISLQSQSEPALPIQSLVHSLMN